MTHKIPFINFCAKYTLSWQTSARVSRILVVSPTVLERVHRDVLRSSDDQLKPWQSSLKTPAIAILGLDILIHRFLNLLLITKMITIALFAFYWYTNKIVTENEMSGIFSNTHRRINHLWVNRAESIHDVSLSETVKQFCLSLNTSFHALCFSLIQILLQKRSKNYDMCKKYNAASTFYSWTISFNDRCWH